MAVDDWYLRSPWDERQRIADERRRVERDRRFYRTINELRQMMGMPPISCPCDPVADGNQEVAPFPPIVAEQAIEDDRSRSERNQPRRPKEDDRGHSGDDSQKTYDNNFTLGIGEIEEPHPWNSIFSNFPPIDSSSPPLLSTSLAQPTQGSSDTKSGADSQLSSSFKGEWQQSVHSFKKDLEDRATGKGEFSIFNNQDLREKLAFSESESPINALCVPLGSFRCLEVLENKEKLAVKSGAHELFDKLSEHILPTKMTSGDILGKPGTKELEELDFVSLIFDPGGKKHKRKPSDRDGILINENGMVSNVCKVFTVVLESANEVVTEPDELLPQYESYTPLIFDPGGAYVWLRICHQPMLPVHWDPGGCFQIVRGLVGNWIFEQRRGVILSSHFTRACMKMMPFERGRADLEDARLCVVQPVKQSLTATFVFDPGGLRTLVFMVLGVKTGNGYI